MNELMAEVLTANERVCSVYLVTRFLVLLCQSIEYCANHEPIWLQKGQAYVMSNTAETGLHQAISLVIEASMESKIRR